MLGQFVSEETFNIEHKEYRFPKHSFPDARSLLRADGVRRFINESVVEIKRFIDKNTGKYLTSFGNASGGTLNLGVSDDGILTGIPIPDGLMFDDFCVIKNWVKCSIQNILTKPYNLHHIEMLHDIVIDVQLLKIDPSHYTEDIESLIKQNEDQTAAYDRAKCDHIEAMRRYEESIMYYKCQINDMVKDKIKWAEFIEYVESHHPPQMVELSSQLYAETVLPFAEGQIAREKTDETKLAYWITKYRDERVLQLSPNRPIMPRIVKPVDIYYVLSKNYNLLISTLVKAGIKFIVISIKFPGGCHKPLLYSKVKRVCVCESEPVSNACPHVIVRAISDTRGPYTYYARD